MLNHDISYLNAYIENFKSLCFFNFKFRIIWIDYIFTDMKWLFSTHSSPPKLTSVEDSDQFILPENIHSAPFEICEECQSILIIGV